MPYILNSLGPARFGALSLIFSLVAYSAILNLGLGKAVTRRLAARSSGASPRDGDRSKTLASAIWAQATIGIMGAAGLALAAGPIVAALRIPTIHRPEVVLAFQIASGVVPLLLVASGFRGALEAFGRFDTIAKVEGTFAAGIYPICALLLQSGYGLEAAAGGIVIGRGCVMLGLAGAVRSHGAGSSSIRKFSLSELKGLLRFGSWVALSDVILPVFSYVDRIFVSAIAGISSLQFYVVPQEIVNRVWIIPAALTNAVFPQVSNRGTERIGEVRRLHAEAVGVAATVMATGASIGILFAVDVLALWIDPDFAVTAGPILQILLVGVAINSVAMVTSGTVQALGYPGKRAAVHAVELPVFVIALILFTREFGVIGAAYAWTLRMATTWLCLVVVGQIVAELRPYTERAILSATTATFSVGSIAISFATGDASITTKALFAALVLSLGLIAVVSQLKGSILAQIGPKQTGDGRT